MKQIICEGIITGPPDHAETKENGPILKFHVAVGAGDGRPDLWLSCAAQGRIAERSPKLRAGDVVTVTGQPMGVGRSTERTPPIFVSITEIVAHRDNGH